MSVWWWWGGGGGLRATLQRLPSRSPLQHARLPTPHPHPHCTNAQRTAAPHTCTTKLATGCSAKSRSAEGASGPAHSAANSGASQCSSTASSAREPTASSARAASQETVASPASGGAASWSAFSAAARFRFLPAPPAAAPAAAVVEAAPPATSVAPEESAGVRPCEARKGRVRGKQEGDGEGVGGRCRWEQLTLEQPSTRTPRPHDRLTWRPQFNRRRHR
jgi:hypothetical protein